MKPSPMNPSGRWRPVAEALPALTTYSPRRVFVLGRLNELSAREIVHIAPVVRRVTLDTDGYAVEFSIEDHNRHGWTISSTFFGEVALVGHWDVCIAQADSHDPRAMGQSGTELLRAAEAAIRAAELWLITTRSQNSSPAAFRMSAVEHVGVEFTNPSRIAA